MKRAPAILTVLCIAVLSAVAGQAAPQPSGITSFFAHVEQVAAGGERLVVSNPTCGALPCPGMAYQLTAIGAPFPPNTVVTTINSRSFQAPVNPRIAQLAGPAIGGLPAGPVLAVPTSSTGAGLTVDLLEIFDFRFGLLLGLANAQRPPVPLSSAPGITVPYQVLAAAGQFFVAEAAGPNITVSRISFTPGATPGSGIWSRTATGTVALAPSPWVSRMAFNAGNLVVAGLGAIAIFDTTQPTTMPLLTTITTPGFNVGTEIATGLVNPGGIDMLVGLRAPGFGPSHAYLAFSSTAPFTPTLSGIDPFGAGLAYAPGFHEIAVSNFGTVATLPLTVAPPAVGSGALGQLTTSPAIVPSSTPIAFTPFGNPEGSRNASRDPVSVYGTNALGVDFVVAIGTGAVDPLGVIAVSPPLAGVVNLTTDDRPLSLPGSSCVTTVSTDAVGVTSVEVFNLGAGPALPPPAATFIAAGGPSSMPTVLLSAVLPVGAWVHGFATGDTVVVCAPAPPTPATCGGTGTPIPPPVAFTGVPPAAAGVALFSARQPQTNVVPGAAAESAVPGSAPGVAGFTIGTIDFCVSGVTYLAPGGLIVTEILAI